MQPKDLLDNVQTRGQFRQLAESSKNEKRLELDSNGLMWELWERMTEYYGSAFVSQYGDEPTATWAHILDGLSPEQFRRGFDLLPSRKSAFPPNPGEFRELIGTDSAWERQCHKEYQSAPRLVDQGALEERIKHNVEAMKKLREETGL